MQSILLLLGKQGTPQVAPGWANVGNRNAGIFFGLKIRTDLSPMFTAVPHMLDGMIAFKENRIGMHEDEHFDVVVVGGGAAGCVMATRLSASGARSVLLLEAPDRRTDLPDEIRDGWRLTRQFDWGYTSEPDEFGNIHDVRRVKLLGGTSWVTRFALRGSPADFDEWQTLGNPGWGFDDVLPYFKRLETDLDFGYEPWHGEQGPIPINRYCDLEGTRLHAGMALRTASLGPLFGVVLHQIGRATLADDPASALRLMGVATGHLQRTGTVLPAFP